MFQVVIYEFRVVCLFYRVYGSFILNFGMNMCNLRTGQIEVCALIPRLMAGLLSYVCFKLIAGICVLFHV